ncbi:MAG: hypothetical protein AAF443_08065 [Chlamydiota bacterium]
MRKNIEDFISSEDKDPNNHPKLRTWEKTIAWIACLSLVIMPILFGWLGFFLSLIASGGVFAFILGGFGLKKISQNPNDAYSKLGSLSLILSLFRPLKVFLFLIFASLLAIWFIGKPYWKIQEQNWKLTHPGQDLPKPKHFGFVFGETTFEEVDFPCTYCETAS